MSRRTAPKRKPAPAPRLDTEAMLAEGLALHQAGRIADAERLYRRIALLEPNNARANQLLGVACLQRGQADEAVGFLTKATELSPDNPEYFSDLGAAQNAASRFEEAIRSFNRAIDLRPDYAQAHSNLGMALKSLGRIEAAVSAYREAIRLRPNEAGFHHNLGNALTELDELHEAEAEYRKALELKPGHPGALSGLALTLSELGRIEEAIAAGLEAIGKRYNVAAYHTALGRAYRRGRQPEKALASFRRAQEIDPRDMNIVRNIALLLKKNEFDSEMESLVQLVGSGKLKPDQEMHVAFALGTWFDDLGDWQRGYEYYVRANKLRREETDFSIEKARLDIEIIRRIFDPMPKRDTTMDDSEGPIFIVGLPRAGKTTLEGVLSQHPKVRSAGELKILSILSRDLSVKYRLSEPGAHISRVPDWELRELGNSYMRHVRNIVPAPFVPVDTMPPNFRLVGLISQTIPNAKVINCVRSPVEQCVAIFQKHFGNLSHNYSDDLKDTAQYYMLYRDTMAYWRQTLPGFILDVDVADFLNEPEATIRRVLDHCRLDFDSRCLSFFQSEPRVGEPARPSTGDREARFAPYRAVLDPVFNS